MFSYLRTNPICADDNLRLGSFAVVENQAHASICFIDRREAAVEPDGPFANNAFEHGMKVAAMDVQIWSAVASFAFGIEDDLVHRCAGIPCAADITVRLDSSGDEGILNIEPCRRLLVDCDRKASTLQESGDG